MRALKASALCCPFLYCLYIPTLSAQGALRPNIPTSAVQQAFESADTGRRFYQNFYDGLRMSLQPADLTLLTAGLLLEQQDKWQGLSLPPTRLDLTLSSQLSRSDGKECFGSISPKYYPRTVATFRLAGVLLLDAIGGQDYAPATYFKLLRFQQALFYNTAFTHLAKRNLSRARPDGSDTQSFFSGHTSTVFATSTFLYLELRDYFSNAAASGKLPLLSEQQWKLLSATALFGWASYVGYARVHDRKHYPTDVISGALSGALISYFVYPRQRRSLYSHSAKWQVRAGFDAMGARMSLSF